METAVRTVFSKYATFSGRAGRAEYWYFYLFVCILMVSTFLFVHLILNDHVFLLSAVALSLVIPHLAVSVRRLHDINKSGWLFLLILIPFAPFLLIYWFCCEGTLGANRFGEQSL